MTDMLLFYFCVLLISTVQGLNCTQGGQQCGSDNECCTGTCITGLCKSGCTVAGYICYKRGDCCSRNCFGSDDLEGKSGICQAGDGGCSTSNTLCAERADCCSYNCHEGVCQEGQDRCTDNLWKCTADTQCCDPWCDDGICSHTIMSSAYTPLIIASVIGAVVSRA